MRYREYAPLKDGFSTGKLNRITDVPRLRVGHCTIDRDQLTIVRTGVTVLRIDDVISKPVWAASNVFNGYGKSIGLVQVDELGTMESHVFFTNTLSIGAVQQGAVKIALRECHDITSFNAVVMECNDSYLSDIASLSVTDSMAIEAYDGAVKDFKMGSVGAGTGMVCFGFKGGIGSSSRMIEIDGREYTLGALVLANFGRTTDLKIPGLVDVNFEEPQRDGGSLIMVLSTDVPLLPHHLKRIARHLSLSIGILGAPGYHGSGDIALAFSTADRRDPQALTIGEDGSIMSRIFKASVWATVEAILDSMFSSPYTKGFHGTVPSILDSMCQ